MINQWGGLLAVMAAIGFSFKAILVKLAYPYGVDTISLLALRMLFSLPFFIAMAFWRQDKHREPLSRSDHAWLIGLGISGYYLASYFDFLGLQYISAGLERLILFLYPTMVVIFSALFLGQSITHRTVGALILSYAGIALAVTHDFRLADNQHEVWIGSGLVFASATCYSLYLIGNGQVVGRLGAARVTAYASSIASIACIGQFLLSRPISALVLPWQVYALSITMAFFCTVLPIYFVSEAIRRIGAGPVSMVSAVGPVVTIFLGWLFLSEDISIHQLIGAALVVGGVMMVGRTKTN